VVLDQRLFPGVGNWMADEILWRARLNPHLHAADLGAAQTRALHRETRFVCRVAMKTIGVDWSDPPKGWLIHVRWKAGGHCPRDRTPLARETIGGRTTAWCPKCQR
jgi:formamidopyrimidine-DNA glycosylase